MTTKISFTILDEIADRMNHNTPDIYFDVFGVVRMGPKSEDYTMAVGQWWRE